MHVSLRQLGSPLLIRMFSDYKRQQFKYSKTKYFILMFLLLIFLYILLLFLLLFVIQEMMYIWNGYTVIGKHKDLTEGMLKTLDEAQQKLEQSPSTVSVQPSA